jgi:hypothetical protein
MASNAFWASHLVEPKRKFKFLCFVGDIPPFVVKSVQRPKQSISKIEISWLNHTFKYTGRNTWDDITIEFIDSEAVNTLKMLQDKLRQSGYFFPTSPSQLNTISKRGAVTALGDIRIQQLTYEDKVMEEWKLVNGWISSIDPGNSDYGTDEPVNVSVTIVFDWAEIETFDPPKQASI